MNLRKRDFERIAAEESTRLQVRRAIDPPKPVSAIANLWDILNSQFVVVVVFGVALGLVSEWWHHQEAKLIQQREDSQFLAVLLPHLTNADVNVRLRAIQVILSRYADNEVPMQVQRLIHDIEGTVKEATSLPNFQQREDTKQLVGSVVGQLDKIIRANPSVPSTLPRASLQVPNEEQRAAAQALAEKFHESGIFAGIEIVGGLKSRPGPTVVKYSNKADEKFADRLAGLLDAKGYSATVDKSPTPGKAGTFQIQLGAVPIVEVPIIVSAPPMFSDGEIRGTNFGSRRGSIFAHLRVKPSSELSKEDYRSGFYPGKLFGHLDSSNYFPLLESAVVSWADDKIVLKFPRGYATGLFDLAIQRAAEAHVAIKESDLEVQYQVRSGPGDEQSDWFPK